MTLFDELEAAQEYRNQVSHSLSAIANTHLAPFVRIYMDAEFEVLDSKHHYIPPLGVFVPGEDIPAQTLLTRTQGVAEGTAERLCEATELCAGAISGHGRLGPEPACTSLKANRTCATLAASER